MLKTLCNFDTSYDNRYQYDLNFLPNSNILDNIEYNYGHIVV